MIPAGVQPAILVGVGGAAGAVTRFGIEEALTTESVPPSVLAANALGTFLASSLVVFGPGTDVVLLASVGFCGALTTFSTFSVRTVSLWRTGNARTAVTFAGGTLLACLGGVGLAVLLGSVV